MKFMWEDCTAYSRGQKDRKSTCCMVKGKALRIVVTCTHIHAPGEWVMHCRPWFDTYRLRVDTLDKAKEKAIRLIEEKVCRMMDDIDTFKAT